MAERVGEYALSDGAPTTGELFSIFASESVEVESLSSIDDKVSGRRLMTSLSVLFLSFFFLAVYLVLLQEPLNRLLSSTRSPSSSHRTRALIFAGIMVAIVLDVAVMLATLSLLHLPISLAVVAGILAVIGYSVNDSVVLWCHIQNLQAELQKGKKGHGAPAPGHLRDRPYFQSRSVDDRVDRATPANDSGRRTDSVGRFRMGRHRWHRDWHPVVHLCRWLVRIASA